MKNKILSPYLVVLVFALFLLIGATNVSAYIGIRSAPVFSADPSDKYLYFQGPNNLFYKIASDNSEIIVASENTLNPITNSPSLQDLTALLATRLGTGSGGLGSATVNIYSSPAVPGDGWCYFQGPLNSSFSNATTEQLYSLAKIKTDGSDFSTFDNLVTTAFSPAAPGDGYIYYFSRINPDTRKPILQGQGGAAELFKIPTTASSISEATTLRQWGLSAPCVSGNGMIYFQGANSRTLGDTPLLGVSTQGGTATFFAASTRSTPFLGPNYQGISNSTLYFSRGFPYSGELSFVYTTGANLSSSGPVIATTPYVAPDLCVYYLDAGNNMYQVNLLTGTTTNLYIQASSTPISCDNGDGTITLFFQGSDGKLKKFTPPLP